MSLAIKVAFTSRKLVWEDRSHINAIIYRSVYISFKKQQLHRYRWYPGEIGHTLVLMHAGIISSISSREQITPRRVMICNCSTSYPTNRKSSAEFLLGFFLFFFFLLAFFKLPNWIKSCGKNAGCTLTSPGARLCFFIFCALFIFFLGRENIG